MNEIEAMQSEIIELTDAETGEAISFEYLMTIEYQDEMYVLLSPMDESEDADEQNVAILRIEQSDGDSDALVPVEDEETLDNVFAIFEQIIEEENMENN